MPLPAVIALSGLALPASHPLAGRGAWQCVTCNGIFYPAAEPTECPYCAGDGDD